MIHDYTQFLGMQDTITEEALGTVPDRSAIEQRLAETEEEKRVLDEQLHSLHAQMDEMLCAVRGLVEKS